MAAGLVPVQRGGAAVTAAISASPLRALTSLWSANCASSPASRIVITEHEQIRVHTPRCALSNVGRVAPTRTFCREGDGGRPNTMVADASEHNGERIGASAGFQGAGGNVSNVAQLQAQSPHIRAGASKWMEAATIIEQNRNPSHNVVGGIETAQLNTDSLKVELERVRDIKANSSRNLRANDVLEIREPEFLSREENRQSSLISEREGTKSLVNQDLRTEEVPRTAFRVDGGSSLACIKAGVNAIAEGRLQSHASYGNRFWSRDSAGGNGRMPVPRAGTTSEAIAGLQNCLQRGITAGSSTYIKILHMCLQERDLLAAKQVHGYIIKSGMDQNSYVTRSLLSVYLKLGELLDARRVFDELQRKTVIDWNSMIAGYANNGKAMSASELFKSMRHKGVRPNQVTYLGMLKACARQSALKLGNEVHECIRRDGFESDLRVGSALVHMYAKTGSIDDAQQAFDRMEKRDVITWTIIIGAYAKRGHVHEAFRLFLQMRREGSKPDAFTYANILNASASAGALELVKEVHGHALQAGLESDLCVGSALVHTYAKSGSLEDARLVFDRLEKRDVVTWTAMIGGLAQHGHAHEALELFRKMNAEHVRPNNTSFVAVLSACCHGGLVDDGRRMFSAMTQEYGIKPNVLHYTLMVDILGRAGHLEEAKQFISEMPIKPNVITWTTLLGACRTYGNVELGELAANELFKLDCGMASTYVLLSNIYAAAGKWEKVASVRTLMQERGARKEAGRSWIEVDNKIHEFVVGDTSHPESEAIYAELKKLSERLKAEGYIPDTRLVLHDINEEDKELSLCSHSEKLAIVYGLLHIPSGEPIRVNKNLRGCSDCHTATKLISKVTGREIIARDLNRFHHFKDGICSCGDYW